ncbi:MAG: hypothetical protein HY243_15830 [Proteobacteria bacterium]|nr:hypothetical protein [Pseudomonadota bacterium]
MKRILLATAAALLMTGTAHADPFANMYANTVSITTPDGKTSKAYVNQDMSWEQHMADGSVLKGTYAWKDAGTACFAQTDPAPRAPAAPNCAKIDEHKVGDTWTVTDDKKQTTTYSLTAGR